MSEPVVDKGRALTVGRAPKTLRQLLVENSAELNFIRLLLALLVLVSHTYPLGGFGTDPSWPTLRPSTTFGGFGVGAFFALSGLLVTMSGVRRTPYEFIRSRFLRIVPAYAAVVVLAALALAPTIWWLDHGTLSGYFNTSATGPVAYMAHNLTFPTGLQYAINDVFTSTTPYGHLISGSAINGSIWTLPLELHCYVVALVIVILGRGLGMTKVAIAALAIVGGVLTLGHFDPSMAAVVTPVWMAAMTELLFVFLCGAVLGTMADRFVVSPPLIAAAVVIFVLTWIAGGLWFRAGGLGVLALLLPVLAALLPRRLLGFFRNDLSYGAYVWAFPVQQTVAYADLTSSKYLFAAVSTAATLGLAGLSWFLIERPALRLRHGPTPVAVLPDDLGKSGAAEIAGAVEPASKGLLPSAPSSGAR